MIGNFEFDKLKINIAKLLDLVKEKQFIYDESNTAGDLLCINNLYSNDKYIEVRESIKDFIFSLPRKELYDLHIAFSIGRCGISEKNSNDEYLLQLDKAEYLCKDKYYLEDKFVDTNYDYLQTYLIKGLKYLYNSNWN